MIIVTISQIQTAYSATWHIVACHIGEFCNFSMRQFFAPYKPTWHIGEFYSFANRGRGIGFRFQYPKFPDMPSCTVLTNFVIAIGQAPETYNNLREMFNYSSILTLFDIGITKQIACDFKVAALLVGIQQAQSKHPCPYCLWRKGVPCAGIPAKVRSYNGVISDLDSKSNNVVNHPIIRWKESPMEVLALAPLHILIGLTNKLYFAARPLETSATKESRQLYKRHCLALRKAKVYRSDYRRT